MKKIICFFVFICIFFFLNISYAQYRKIKAFVSSGTFCYNKIDFRESLTVQLNKKNKVKLIYYYITGSGDDSGNISIDNNGNPTEILESKFSKMNKSVYKYDINGRLIEEIEDNIKINYLYNEKGKLSKGYSEIGSTEYKYDENNNLIEEIDYNSNGKFNGKTFYRYENGNNVEQINYSKDGSIYNKTVYIFDGKKKAKLLKYKGNDTISYTQSYKYDSNDNLTETYSPTGGYLSCKYYYDKKNLLIKKMYEYFNQTEMYIYDSNGCIRAVIEMENNEIVCYTGYTYWYYKDN